MTEHQQLQQIESKIAELIDNWYLQKKEELKGKGPHELGREKEKLKLIVNMAFEEMASYVEKVRGR